MSSSRDGRLVYSTGLGRIRICRQCGEPEDRCRCKADRNPAPARPGAPRDGVVRITLDRKGRGGKAATLILGLPGDDAELAALAQTLKRLCGVGGSAKQGEIILQGDHRDKVEAKLRDLGYTVKRMGG